MLNGAECVSSIKDLKANINNAIHQDDLFQRHRSHSIWLPVRDKNTKYFHNRANQCRRKNHILRIFDNEGKWCTSEVWFAQVAEAYFQDLFSSTQPNNIESFLNSFESRVTPQMNESLTRKVHPKRSPNSPILDARIKINESGWYVPFLFSKILAHCKYQCHGSCPISFTLWPYVKKMKYKHIVLIPKKDPKYLADIDP